MGKMRAGRRRIPKRRNKSEKRRHLEHKDDRALLLTMENGRTTGSRTDADDLLQTRATNTK